MKGFWLLSTVEKLLKNTIPSLSHEADGLIFQVTKRCLYFRSESIIFPNRGQTQTYEISINFFPEKVGRLHYLSLTYIWFIRVGMILMFHEPIKVY